MKILIYIGYIGENAVLVEFFVILADIPLSFTAGLKCYEKKICDLPILPDNHKLLAKFHSGTLRITDPGD